MIVGGEDDLEDQDGWRTGMAALQEEQGESVLLLLEISLKSPFC